MDVKDFDFDLPQHLIAQTPLPERTSSRLLTLDKRTGHTQHEEFANLHHYLQKGDCLVLNDTKVLPARLLGTKQGTGARVEVLLLKDRGADRWETLIKPAKRLKIGHRIQFGEDESGMPLLTAIVEEERDQGGRILSFHYSGLFLEVLDQLGSMPLPPYIKQQLQDRDRYQTVYARNIGSAAAPTAGLHFSDAYLRKLASAGIIITYVTLHVGLGTFRPVSATQVEDHHMHAEYYELSQQTADLINTAKANGNRVVAVGTTSTRTLETIAAQHPRGRMEACNGWTDIFIYPGYSFQVVDALLTNFHLPKSTLLMLVSALANREYVLQAYLEAIEEQYRFFSFGDAMFIY